MWKGKLLQDQGQTSAFQHLFQTNCRARSRPVTGTSAAAAIVEEAQGDHLQQQENLMMTIDDHFRSDPTPHPHWTASRQEIDMEKIFDMVDAWLKSTRVMVNILGEDFVDRYAMAQFKITNGHHHWALTSLSITLPCVQVPEAKL